MGYITMIGLEMHCEASETNSKVFSSARNTYSTTPNENIRPYDMGFPGVLPVVNKEAVKKALMASIILKGEADMVIGDCLSGNYFKNGLVPRISTLIFLDLY